MPFGYLAANVGTVTADMLKPISETFNSNVGVIMPIGIAIMGAMVGIGLIPRIIYKFL